MVRDPLDETVGTCPGLILPSSRAFKLDRRAKMFFENTCKYTNLIQLSFIKINKWSFTTRWLDESEHEIKQLLFPNFAGQLYGFSIAFHD